MTDVVLFNPKYAKILNVGGLYYTPPPLDVCYIASLLEQNGFTVKIFDSNIEDASFIDFLLEEKPKVLGATAPSLALPFVYDTIRDINARTRGLDVILTGQHVTGDPGILLELGLRYGFNGYCELGFAELCKYLIRGEGDLSNIDGLIRNVNKKITVNKKNSAPFDGTPFPARHLLKTNKYKFFSISASRGCPYDCVYCSSTGPFYPHSRQYSLRTPESVVNEIKDFLSKFNACLFDFVDDVFTYNQEYVKTLCRLIREEGLNVKWTCSTRPDLISEEIADVMKKAGCIQVCIGVESGSEEVRKKASRDIAEGEIKNAFRACRKAGLRTRASAIVGLPGETKSTIEDTLALLKELKPNYVFLYPAILLPGSKLFDMALEEELIPRDVWARYMRGEAPLPIYIPSDFTRKEISDCLRDGHRRFYVSLDYLLQRLTQARNIADLKEYAGFMHNFLRGAV